MTQRSDASRFNLGWIGRIIIGVVVLVLLLMLLRFAGQFFYFFEEVNPEEVGVRMKGGQIEDVVGPGLY